jgi:hypothetical protein
MLLLRDHPERPAPGLPEEGTRPQDDVQPERPIVCAACAAMITSLRHRIAVQGAHQHRFMNPAGLLFHIGCFDQAVGCVVVGPASTEYAWFPGFAWRLALCGQCGRQLGWQFRNDAREGFFGLILDRVRESTLDG